MRIREILREGGWDSVVTQGTRLTPAIVPKIIKIVEKFVQDFNTYANDKGWHEIRVGSPTGSSSHWRQDLKEKPDTEYGDVDLQIEVPKLDLYAGLAYTQLQNYWYAKWLEFIETTKPPYVHEDTLKRNEEGTNQFRGHLILDISDATNGSMYAQVDLMPHANARWGKARVTPERGLKGLLHGNMFSVLGELLGFSIQHAGVQYKARDGKRVPFTTRKDVTLYTLSDEPDTFIRDIFDHEYKVQDKQGPAKIDVLLTQHPGVNPQVHMDPSHSRISDLVAGVHGLARSFTANNMYGKGHLEAFPNADAFRDAFWTTYEDKANRDIESSKRAKAATPEAQAKADRDKEKIRLGLEKVRSVWNNY